VTTDPGTGSEAGGPPRLVILAAVALAVAVIGGILAIAALREAPRPVAVSEVPAPQAESPACHSLAAALPQRLGDYQRVAIAQPAPAGATAWRAGPDGEPVVLRCGLDRPADFVVGSPIQMVDRVQWFEMSAGRQPAGDTGASIWCTVDRPVYVGLTLPPGSGPTPIQQLSDVIDHTLAAVPIDPAPPG
jgi:hypothetical protein